MSKVAIQHVPLLVIPAVSGDRKGDTESRNLIFLYSGNDNLNIEIVDTAE